MKRIDFYILPDSDAATRLTYACRLAAKAWREGHRIYLHCQDQAQAEALDARLWSFSAASFVPHQLADAGNDAPLLLAWGPDAGGEQSLLINLASSVPAFFERFARIAEVVNQDPQTRDALRTSYRFYRERGYAPQHLHL
ncbi:DNA polymerase III subunit chi [Pseudomonas sp. MAP12]|uniref:DNA polymerase III subunit chi n=1 Tax=Geopseudomonas aromaticivorans TaxID=2849492 RepID=A0ABS6MYH2_9GAMM|nr:DNA polymerase III subunit chi [Pseudomonas aromaticivorans]MBV2133825.1 DNA polymerase III subunit chi [Pseudomonas aromaticivorans]